MLCTLKHWVFFKEITFVPTDIHYLLPPLAITKISISLSPIISEFYCGFVVTYCYFLPLSFLFNYFLFFETRFYVPPLIWNLLSSWGWIWILNTIGFISWVLGLQTCSTLPGLCAAECKLTQCLIVLSTWPFNCNIMGAPSLAFSHTCHTCTGYLILSTHVHVLTHTAYC